jgi:hypothetical protein
VAWQTSSSRASEAGPGSGGSGNVEDLLRLLVDAYLPGRLQAMVDHRTRLAAAGISSSSSSDPIPGNDAAVGALSDSSGSWDHINGSNQVTASDSGVGTGLARQALLQMGDVASWDVPPTGVNLRMLGVLLVPLAAGQAPIGSPMPPEGGVLQPLGPKLIHALGRVLQRQQGMPAMGLWLAGWLLHQLLPAEPAGVGLDAPRLPPGAQAGGLLQQQQAAAGLGGSSNEESLGSRLVGAGEAHEAAAAAESWNEALGSSGLGLRGLPDGTTLAAASNSSAVSGHSDFVSCAGDSFLATPLPSVTSVGMVGVSAGSCLPADLHEVMQQQVQQAQQQFCRALGGMWCEALVPMVAMEWPAAREMLLRPVLRASTEALLSGSHAHPLLLQQQGSGLGGGRGLGDSPSPVLGVVREGLSVSAREAVGSYCCVQRVVALQLIEEVGEWVPVGRGTVGCLGGGVLWVGDNAIVCLAHVLQIWSVVCHDLK